MAERAGFGAGGALVRLPESGYGWLVAYVAGPAHVRGFPTTAHPLVRVDCLVGGQWGRSWHERTAADQEDVDEGIRDYLAAAGAPPGPSGHTWELRLPPGVDEAGFWSSVNTAVFLDGDDAPLTPSVVRRTLEDVLPALLTP